ncbi:MAG TPA: SigE family RNA polymerase sigma factor [Jatrophihabitantaceae bacterium]|nr:SigE family RNA polymerase sigma factor [Jatrophihabitantaceae bacterium]
MDVELGFAEFVRAQTAALLRTAYLLTGNGHSAEELVQDTLVRLYGKWDRVQAAEQPVAYVRRALANAYINDRRRASSREIRLDVIPERVDVRDMTGRIADRDELWPLLLALPNRQRAAIVLRYYSDLSDAEIAAALDCRVGTVRSLISRGLATMRQSTDGTTAAGRTS